MTNRNQRPIRVYDAYPVKLAIWQRTVESATGSKLMRSATFERVYRDQSGKWQTSRSLNVEDLPKAMMLAQRAFLEFGISLDEPAAQ